ncbi:hypothetical protein MNBD_GAMMA12-1679 [hydrothermal vent metagenome]|uniref:Uncharacterized protein n=1 Tax=hydrothermal vent metagenome TaxID=652676 RepID=A0A3B0YAC5_9ZZZZ
MIHGELIALGIAIDKKPEYKKAKAAQDRFDIIFKEILKEWTDKSERYIVGKNFSGDGHALQLVWKYGYILEVGVGHDYDKSCPDTDVLLQEILQKPLGQFVQSITVKVTDGGMRGYIDFESCLSKIVLQGRQPNLKKLVIGDCYPPEADLSWCSVGDCSGIFSLLPNLEYIKTRGRNVIFGKLKHQKLKKLLVESGGLSAEAVKSIAKADLPSLESLEVWFGSKEYGAQGSINMIKPLLQGKGYPKLKHLGLMNAEFQNEITQALVKAPIVKQLSSLDLSMGTMTDKGAQALVDNVDTFIHLDYIDVCDNFLSEQMSSRLRRVYSNKINISEQGDPDEDEDGDSYIYVSAGE